MVFRISTLPKNRATSSRGTLRSAWYSSRGTLFVTMSSTELERLAEAFAAADITEDWIAGVQDEMRGASSMEGQCVVLRALLNACAGAGIDNQFIDNQFEALTDLLTGDDALPGLAEYFVKSAEQKASAELAPPMPQVDDEETTDLMRAALAGDLDQLHSLLLAEAPI